MSRAGQGKLITAGACVLFVVDVACLVASDWIQSRVASPGMSYSYLRASKKGAMLGVFVA